MKIRRLLFGVFTSFAFVGFGASTFVAVKAAVLVKGTVTSSSSAPSVTIASKTVYCRVEEAIATPTTMYVYVFSTVSGSNTGWTSCPMTLENGGTAASDKYTQYSASIPVNFDNGGVSTNYDRIMFHNGKSGADEDKTSDLVFSPLEQNSPSDTLVAYDISSTTAQGDGDGGYFYKGSFIRITVPSLSSSYERIWLNRQGNYEDNYLWTLHYYGGATDVEVTPQYANMQSTRESGNYWLAYYDVNCADLLGKTVQFKAYTASSGAFNVGTTNTSVYAAGDNSEIYFINYDSTNKTFNYSRGSFSGNSGEIDAASLKSVFYPYYSCSSSKDNGYGSFAQIKATWITNGSVSLVSGSLDAVIINDFSSQSDYATGGNKNYLTTLQAKINIMSSRYESSLLGTPSEVISPQQGDASTPTLVAVLIGLGTGTIIATAAFLRAKKKNA